jgi:hypothetical protein
LPVRRGSGASARNVRLRLPEGRRGPIDICPPCGSFAVPENQEPRPNVAGVLASAVSTSEKIPAGQQAPTWLTGRQRQAPRSALIAD